MKAYVLRFSKPVAASADAADPGLVSTIRVRESEVKQQIARTDDPEQRKRLRVDLRRLANMRAQLAQPRAPVLRHDDPKVRAAIHRAIRTRRQAIKRQLVVGRKGQHLTVKGRTALLDELRDLDDIESQLFGVIHSSPKSFPEYGGRFPTADDIIHNAVIQRCLKSGKPHLILPKLAAIFPANYRAALAQEVKTNPKVRRVVHRMKAGQIKGEYNDPIERLIAENYFDSNKLSKPLCRLSRDEAVEQLAKHFQKRITVDKYRRHVKSLFLSEYS